MGYQNQYILTLNKYIHAHKQNISFKWIQNKIRGICPGDIELFYIQSPIIDRLLIMYC